MCTPGSGLPVVVGSQTKWYPNQSIGCSASRASAQTIRPAAFLGSAFYEARNQYIDWQEFYLWVRSILEVETRIPDWLVEILNDRCPGFLENETELTPKAAKSRPLHLRLEDWIDEHVLPSPRRKAGSTQLPITR